MNITIDNYEAYLLDYLEGELSPEGAAELQAFVTAQGMDWAELTEALPHLEAPQIEYENKEGLKKKPIVVPLYVKIASAAAAAGLLLTVGLWPEKQLPKVEPIAELTPIKGQLTVTEDPIRIIPRKVVQFTDCQQTITIKESKKTPERTAIEAITPMSPMQPQEALAFTSVGLPSEPDPDMLRYRLEAEQAMAYLMEEETFEFEEEMPTSLIGKGIYRMTEGRHRSIGDLISAGLHLAKKEVVKASTDMAMAAYYRADEHFEDAKERWKEKNDK